MLKLIWSPESLGDIQRLYRFLVSKNPDAAKRAASAIRKAANALQESPDMGKPVDDLPHEFREMMISFGSSGYVMLYRREPTLLIVLAIRHQKEAGYSRE
jgi:plasmid stabilization system protein ParE